MVQVQINNNVIKLSGPRKVLNEVYDNLGVRNPNAFYLRKYMPRGWDGKQHYLTENGTAGTGLYPMIHAMLIELEQEVEVTDLRGLEGIKVKVPKVIGSMEVRDYQYAALKSLADNHIGDTWFPRGIFGVATNGGKTLLSAGIHTMFNQKTILLTGSTELFTQGLVEWEELLPGKVGYIGNGKVVWNDFMVCMVKTLSNKAYELSNILPKYKTVIVDECDLADNKTFNGVLKYLYNAPIKVGLSGTVFMSDLKKDLIKNMNTEKQFGKLLYDITNKVLIDKGHSSKVEVNFIKGNTKEYSPSLPYSEVYEKYIVRNKQRNTRIVNRIAKQYISGRKPILVIAQRQKHIKIIYKRLKERIPGAKIDWVHHDRKERKQVVDEFKNGFTEILVGSMILKRGKNFPLMQYMLNAAGGKGQEGVIQLLGRAMRKHISKEVTIYEDMWDEGEYLKSHSRRRFSYYKKQEIPVTNKYK